MVVSSLPEPEAFWARVDTSGECWLWQGARIPAGYGQITRRLQDTRVHIYAHRVAWEPTHGPIPPGLHVCHRCDNPPCVRPEHLFVGTIKDNMRDRSAKGRGYSKKGITRAKLSESNVVDILRLYATGECTKDELADRFGVSRPTINGIVRGRFWKHIDRAAVLAATQEVA
jgi:DNA-binding XRE family transcriptional regulator